jgi:hypothetical protein
MLAALEPTDQEVGRREEMAPKPEAKENRAMEVESSNHRLLDAWR